jgi:outer membrane receptor protein involved in Fe transport
MNFFSSIRGQGTVCVHNTLNSSFNNPLINQIMRISIILLFIFISCMHVLLAFPAKGQLMSEAHVAIGLERETLKDAIKKIEQQTSFRFYYRNADIKDLNNLFLSEEARTVEQTLNEILRNSFLSFTQVENNILIEKLVQTTYQMKGKVLGINHLPIDFATITIKELNTDKVIQSRMTDTSGHFEFQISKKGSYLITASAIGMDSLLISLTLAEKKVVELGDIVLSELPNNLNEVTIIGKKAYIEQKIDMTVLNVENSSLAVGNSVLDVLQRAPGVYVANDGKINLKGKAGASILIDGKLTYLAGDQLIAFLRSMQSSSVRNIELITNPSAKYDAAGAGGIINIRLKKNVSYGLNGNISLSAGYGKNFKSSGGTNFNYRTKNLNVYGDFYLDYNNRLRELEINRISPSNLGNTFFDQNSDALIQDKNHYYKAGLDYYLNDNNVIGFLFNGHANSGDDQTANYTRISNDGVRADSVVTANNPTHRSYNYAAYNLNYKSTLDTAGQEFNVDLDYASYDNGIRNGYDNHFFDPAGNEYKSPYAFRSDAPTKVKILSAKADYTYPLSATAKLSAGIKSSYVKTDNDIVFENKNANIWQNDLNRSNQFQYSEHINAAYVNLQLNLKFAELQVGLRGEQTNSKGNSITLKEIVNTAYLNLFPTVFLRRKLSESHNIGLSYSRRIDRPNYVTLNPFVYNIDLYSFSRGNPYLKPQFTNVIELSHVYKSKLYITLSHSQTNDAITEVTVLNADDKTLTVGDQNLAKQEAFYLSLSFPLKVSDWWNMNNSMNVSHNKFSTPNLMGAPFESGSVAYNFNINQSFSINSTTTADLLFNYRSASVYGTYFIQPMYHTDLGIKKTFFDKKIALSIASNDLFNTYRERIKSVIPGQDYRIYQKYESQIFRLGFSYRFGSNQVKSARDRSKSSDTEERRVKN